MFNRSGRQADPVEVGTSLSQTYQRDGAWYFGDENGAEVGPYDSDAEARQEHYWYGLVLDGHINVEMAGMLRRNNANLRAARVERGLSPNTTIINQITGAGMVPLARSAPSLVPSPAKNPSGCAWTFLIIVLVFVVLAILL